MEPRHSTRRVGASSETGTAGVDAGVMVGYSCYQGTEPLRTGLAEGRCSRSSWSDTDQTL